MTTDHERAAALAAARRRTGEGTGGRGASPRRRPGAASALVATGATVGGGLTLVGLMAAAARTPTPVVDVEAPTTAPATDTANAGGEVRTIRRVVVPVAPGTAGSNNLQATTAGAPAVAAPAVTSQSAPVTRSNGS